MPKFQFLFSEDQSMEFSAKPQIR